VPAYAVAVHDPPLITTVVVGAVDPYVVLPLAVPLVLPPVVPERVYLGSIVEVVKVLLYLLRRDTYAPSQGASPMLKSTASPITFIADLQRHLNKSFTFMNSIMKLCERRVYNEDQRR
jgi:hypothetical protein